MKDFNFDITLKKTDKGVLSEIVDLSGAPKGAFSIRKNGEGVHIQSTKNVTIKKKQDKPGIDVIIKPNTKNESIHIPVIITEDGVKDVVYNDFYIGEGCDIEIVAGCGIHNCGNHDSEHDGIHIFHIEKDSKLKYIEKHYGEGDGNGKKILNPVTEVEVGENAYCEMEMIQIKGVDSTKRDTKAKVHAGGKLVMIEKLMTHGNQEAYSNMEIELDGEDSSAQIISRSVGKNQSKQVFYPNAIGNNKCRAHIQCDSIIMDDSKISSIPAIVANHPDAQVIHEAAIGKINNDQLMKLQTFGMSEEEAEEVIVQGFLK